MKKIKYGIIGAGQMACDHKICIEYIDDIELVAVADISQESMNAFSHYSKAIMGSRTEEGLRNVDILYDRKLENQDNHRSYRMLGKVHRIFLGMSTNRQWHSSHKKVKIA